MSYLNYGTVEFPKEKTGELLKIIGSQEGLYEFWPKLVRNGYIEVEDIGGDIEKDLEKIVSAASEKGIPLSGRIEWHQSVDDSRGTYFVYDNKLESCTYEQTIIADADTEELVRELENRGYTATETIEKSDDETDWIIGIGGSENDGVCMYKFTGSCHAVKEELVKLVAESRAEDDGCWDYGTENAEEVQERAASYYAYACFCDRHVDYEAYPLNKICGKEAA